MRIIRPYGHSKTVENQQESQRVLQDKQGEIHDIADYAQQHDELIIAQWISIIDKIARKPNQENKKSKVSSTQYQLRNILGCTAWGYLISENYIDTSNADRKKYLSLLWQSKIHPYDKDALKALNQQSQKQLEKEIKFAKGRWYTTFVGSEIKPEQIDQSFAIEIIKRIEKHLYVQEVRQANKKAKKTGKIQSRAESIRKNVLQPAEINLEVNSRAWTDAEEQAYANAGDIADSIYQYAKARLNGEHEHKPKQLTPDIAATCLYQHWAKVFQTSHAQVMTIEQAKTQQPHLFALHMAIKDSYTRMLKQQNRPSLIAFPKDMSELYRLVSFKQKNQELAHLIRLGKVLHYSEGGIDEIDVSSSSLWHSDGQAKIKRAEAYVRVWRQVIGQANLSLANWVSMKQTFQGDCLSRERLERWINQDCDEGKVNYDTRQLRDNTHLLFGNHATLFTENEELNKAAIESAKMGMAELRNTTFHFKKRDKFLETLDNLPEKMARPLPSLANAINELWSTAWQQRLERLLASLEAIHLHYYFDEQQVNQLVSSLSHNTDAHLPLPRFSRVLLRNANVKNRNRLPPPANRAALEKPARKCQYTSLKLLYERAFRTWLEKRSTTELRNWVDSAIERTNKAAKAINGKHDEDKRLLIMARASQLNKLQQGSTIKDFFFILSAETATEMRVQRGYQSDAEKARKQAAYIDDLLCDVITLAFNKYLKQQALGWLLDLNEDTGLPEQARCTLPNIPAQSNKHKDWQASLYFLLHLIPVGDVSQLLHQLAKWEITAGREQVIEATEHERLMALQQTLKLYLDMHDSQFMGNEPQLMPDDIAGFHYFYDEQSTFESVFVDQSGELTGENQHLPQRELREARRFGHLPLLRQVAGDRKINMQQVNQCLALEKVINQSQSPIEQAQQQRETLHEKWAKSSKRFDEYRDYCEALQTVIKHRKQANWIRLVDHIRAHRLVIKVLVRLVDYSGLFERDLYFATLALLHQSRLAPSEFFTEKGLKYYLNGQIIEALRKTNKDESETILKKLKEHFQFMPERSCEVVKIRNDLAHFNMLHSDENGKLNQSLNLSDWVNKTRKLMAYDRKLKNAVSKSLKELLQREGLILSWQMGDDHQLTQASLKAKTAIHVSEKAFPMLDQTGKLKKDNKGRLIKRKIEEALHSPEFVNMMAAIFAGTAKSVQDISDIELDMMDWSEPKKTGKSNAKKRPNKHKKNNRNRY